MAAGSWNEVFSVARALAMAGMLVALSMIVLIAPAYLSGRYQMEMSFQVVAEPDGIDFPITAHFERDQALRSIACIKSEQLDSEALYLLDCSFVAEEISDARNYLEAKGFTFGNLFRISRISPMIGPGWNQAIVLAFGLVLWAAWLKLFRHSLRDDVRRAFLFIRSRPWAAILPFVLALATGVVVTALFRPLTQEVQTPVALTQLSGILVMAVLVAPVFEEVVFRGLVMDILGKHMRWWLAAIPTTLGFAAVHLVPSELALAAYATYLVFGFSLCWIRHVSSSLTLCVLIHALYNAIAIGVFFMSSVTSPG
ncbi:CPBP family intramembrane glutamic endopeptidase [Luteimonas sp. MJ293]